MLRRKISNKILSRNLQTKNTVLRMLPTSPSFSRHHCIHMRNDYRRRRETLYTLGVSLPQQTVYCERQEDIQPTMSQGHKMVKRKTRFSLPPISFQFSGVHYIVVLIVCYLAAGTLIVMIQDGTESLKNIVIYSIVGFFTFFMGYMGWILAKDVLNVVAGKKKCRNEVNVEL
ncbi:MAG: hypothetical protein JXA00_05655 [Candidatus Thermoplasmatota archaeon]|nr:hypothetical protein [Candidatus Thermoplasmatota archaeon]